MSTPTITPTTVDLCSLSQAKDWLGIDASNTDDDSTIAGLVTSFSQWIINTTGIASFNCVQNFTETYDGNGSYRMFLNNRPITDVTSIVIGNYSIPKSSGPTIPGWFIEQSKKSIAFRSSAQYMIPASTLTPFYFCPGVGNIVIAYSAGFSRVPADLQEVCFKAVAIHYRRKDWIDQDSKALTAGASISGTIKYRAWDLPPEDKLVINHYRRYSRS